MRVVHVACVAPPEIGGIGQVAWAEMFGLRGRGYDASLIVPEPAGGVPPTWERVHVERVSPLIRIGNASWISSLSSMVRGADIVHVHYPCYGMAEQLLLRATHLPPIVVTFHMDAHADGWKGALFEAHRKLMQPHLLLNARHILVTSLDYVRQSSLRSFAKRFPTRITPLPLGVDTDFFCPGPRQRHRFLLDENVPVLLFVGGLDDAHAFKGLSDLLRAFSGLSSDLSATLLVIGDGNRRTRYEEEARRLGIASRVHFFGRVDQLSLRDAYRTADVFVLPSSGPAEAFGLVLVEAQACGLPVIARDAPGVRTVIRHGETGWLVSRPGIEPLQHAILAAIGPATQGQRMKTSARKWAVDTFSEQAHLDGLIRCYRSICGLPS